MSEPYDVTTADDADRGLRRLVDRTGRETVVSDPDVVWWEGPTACASCGWTGRSVVPVTRDRPEPPDTMECGGCGGRTLRPAGDPTP